MKTNTLIVIALGTLLFLAGAPSHAALHVMMKLMINGQEVEGGVKQQGYEKRIFVLSLSQETSIPLNQGTGMAAGTRTHQPLIITKEIDKVSPLLVKALVNQERIDAVFTFRRLIKTGVEKEFYRIGIQDARVLAVNHILSNTLDPAKMQYPPLQEVSFGYNQISWTWLPDNTTFSDGIRQPMSGMLGSGSPSHSITEPSAGAKTEQVFKEGEMIQGIEKVPASQGAGLCCVYDGLHEMSAEGCRNEGGVFYRDRATALRSCGNREEGKFGPTEATPITLP